jgi:hypothetical protein
MVHGPVEAKERIVKWVEEETDWYHHPTLAWNVWDENLSKKVIKFQVVWDSWNNQQKALEPLNKYRHVYSISLLLPTAIHYDHIARLQKIGMV